MSAIAHEAPGWDCHAHVFDPAAAALPGHYVPPDSRLATLEGIASAHGISRIVLVQPSVYGTDNALMLSALRAQPGRHRGIVVIDEAISDMQMREMAELGVRGVRFNLVSPVGNDAGSLDALAPRLRDIGWHVQWHVGAEDLPRIASLQARHRLTFVLDHIAGITPADAPRGDVWSSLERIAGAGGWIKFSAWYRLRAERPYAELDDAVARAHALFASRCVFGSDWPHTWFLSATTAPSPPAYGDLLLTLARALGQDATREVLRHNPPRLYA